MTFWVSDSRVVAGMSVNTWDVMPTVKALIRERQTVDVGRLADPAVPLDQLTTSEATTGR